MGVRNEVHASMEVYVKHTSVTHSTIQLMTYFGWSGAHFGQIGGEDSAEVEVVAAAAAVVEPGAVGGPTVVVAVAAELPAVAAEISVAAAAG